MSRLEDFMVENKECWENFNRFISGKITFAPEKDGKMVRCSISGDISKIISDFFKKNKEILDTVERNKDAEKCYINNWSATKKAALDQVKDDSVKKETEKRFDKITDIFKVLLEDRLTSTSAVKQCEQRFKQRIEKYPFPKDPSELIYQGLFFMMLVHYFAWKEKNKVKAEKLEPEPQKIDSIFNNPAYGGSGIPIIRGKSELEKKCLVFMLSYPCREGDKSCAMPVEYTDDACAWIQRHPKRFNQMLKFNKEAQEGAHKVLLTYDNRSGDPFVNFIFGRPTVPSVRFAYYFKGSKVENVKINSKDTGLQAYIYPSGWKEDAPDGWLDANLKTIWFRDIIKEKKNYKKMTMDEMHEVAKAYEGLLNRKIVKYVQVTYQCVGDKILVSFKTNHFDTPPVVLNEADFKKFFNSPEKGTVLYRGTNIAGFESMKKEGISHNTKKHNEQWFDAGVYWDKKVTFAQKYGDVIAMAITCDKLPSFIADTLRNPMFSNTFLMRDNQCLVIRETAMCDERIAHTGSLEDMKMSPEAKNVVFCKTDKEVKDWLKCR